jgi:hypothetical protein
MVKDHRISARAENTRKLSGHLVALVLGGTLSLAAIAAYGAESLDVSPKAAGTSGGLALAPIPYLDTMQWLTSAPAAGTMKVDILLSPAVTPSGIKPDLAPLQRDRPLPTIS